MPEFRILRLTFCEFFPRITPVKDKWPLILTIFFVDILQILRFKFLKIRMLVWFILMFYVPVNSYVMSLLVNYVLSLMGTFRHGKVLIHVHSLTCPYMYLAIDCNGMLNRKTNLKHIKMNFMNCFSLLMFTFGNFKEIK